MRKRLFIALLLLLLLIPMGVAQANKPLKFDTTYSFAAIPPYQFKDGRVLTWIGNVEGESFHGVVKYWMHLGDPAWNRETGIVTHWDDAVFEIYELDEFGNPVDDPILVGLGGGTSTMLVNLGFGKTQKFATWRSTGQIIEANGIFADYYERPFHDGGDVEYPNPPDYPGPYGEGTLIIH